jgi:hypothetical protein
MQEQISDLVFKCAKLTATEIEWFLARLFWYSLEHSLEHVTQFVFSNTRKYEGSGSGLRWSLSLEVS